MNSVCSAARNQVTILGINSLFGKVVSFLLKQSPVANRLVLYDEVDIRVAHDIAEIPTPCKIVVYNGEEQLRCAVRNSDVILIGDKDDCLANDDEAISRKAADIVRYAQAISSIAPNAIVLIAATPVNSLLPLFTEAQIGCGTFDSDKVMGVTSADTMRASTLLARHMGIEPEKAYLPVIGGSSADTRIPLFSQSRPTINANKNDLKNLTRVVKMTEDELKRLLNRGEALNKAYATVQLIDSVMSALRGQRNISEIVLSRTCLVPNVDYFSLPVILGPRGIAHRFPLPSMTERETILLDHAVKHIEIDKMKGINALSGECCIPQAPEMTEKYSELINCTPNDLVGSLMEKFKIRVDCPEVCEPRVEYKLLSKVKMKLPPESNPSEVPKRSKFIEPDTPPQDGCCPLKLPCPPIPPIRGLNQIQAKHTCKSRDQPKACKCFFPPVEKSLVPCKLCPSNKPCVDYGDFKTFYEEYKHCCGPVSCTGEVNPCSDVALTSAGSNSHNAIATHETSLVQPVSPNESNSTVTLNASDIKVLSSAPGETVKASAEQPKKMIFHAVLAYPQADLALQPVPNPTSAVAQQSPQTTTNKVYPQGQQSNLEIQTSNPNFQESASDVKKSESWSSTGAATEPSFAHSLNAQNTNKINQQNSTQSQNPTIQHDDPNWPFRCSTALCLDVLAPKPSGYAQGKSAVPEDHISRSSGTQNQTDLQNLKHSSMNINPQNPPSNLLTEQNMNAGNQQEQRKRYNYSSGLSLTHPQDVIEEIRPVVNENSTHSSYQECSRNIATERSSEGIQTCHQPYTYLFPEMPNDGRRAEMDSISNNVTESYDKLAALSIQNQPVNDSNVESTGAIKVESQSAAVNSSSMSEGIMDHTGPTDSKTLYDRRTWDENVKRRLYATLKVIEDIKSDPQPSTSTINNTTGISLSQHFNDEPKLSKDSKNIPKPEESSENSMISILRERAKAINANMELQRDLQACLERSKRKRRKENLGLGDLIDTINPAKRLPKRLESRPALRKAYRGMRKMYEDPKRLGSQGKSASILVTPKPDHEEKSLVIVENPKESKKLESRIDKIKARIQEALKKIIYPADTPSEIKPAEKISKHQQRLSHKLVTRPAMRRSSNAKHDFFIEMRKMDPAYRPTTRTYAPKCPTRLLYDDHPKNHSKMITFNNVIENETMRNRSSMRNHVEPSSDRQEKIEGEPLIKHASSQTDIKPENKCFIFPDIPDFPELVLRDMEPKRMPKEVHKIGALYSQSNSMLRGAEPKRRPTDGVRSSEVHAMNQNPQEARFSGILQGDYVKHFDNQSLPKDTNAILPESVKAAIRECSRNVATPGSMKSHRRNDMRYGMTSPNRMTYSYSRKPN